MNNFIKSNIDYRRRRQFKSQCCAINKQQRASYVESPGQQYNRQFRGINNLKQNMNPPSTPQAERPPNTFQDRATEENGHRGRERGHGGRDNWEERGGDRGRGRPPLCMFCIENQGHTLKITNSKKWQDNSRARKITKRNNNPRSTFSTIQNTLISELEPHIVWYTTRLMLKQCTHQHQQHQSENSTLNGETPTWYQMSNSTPYPNIALHQPQWLQCRNNSFQITPINQHKTRKTSRNPFNTPHSTDIRSHLCHNRRLKPGGWIKKGEKRLPEKSHNHITQRATKHTRMV